jgi:hypothetical protein
MNGSPSTTDTRLKGARTPGLAFYVAVKVTNSRCYNTVYTTHGVSSLFGFLLPISSPTDAFPD